MVKINSVNGQNNIPEIKTVKSQGKKTLNNVFKEKLDNLKQEQIKDELKVLFSKIENQTMKLQDRLFIEDLVEYKKTVKDFLDITVNNSHIFYKENSLDRRGRHRVYSIVKKVDTELDELTNDFLHIENNRLRILNRLDDIKGLLLDILT